MMHADSTTLPAPVRAGGTVLSLVAAPLSVPILQAHIDGPLRLPDLRERIGGAAQTTLRGQVGNLRGIGALERHVRGGMPYTVENELTDVGREVLAVAETVEAWLLRAPQGPILLGSESAKGALRALIGGWGSTMLPAVADGVEQRDQRSFLPGARASLERDARRPSARAAAERWQGCQAIRGHRVDPASCRADCRR